MRQPTSHSWTRPVIAVAVAKLAPLSAMFTKSRTADVSLFLTDSRMMNNHHVESFRFSIEDITPPVYSLVLEKNYARSPINVSGVYFHKITETCHACFSHISLSFSLLSSFPFPLFSSLRALRFVLKAIFYETMTTFHAIYRNDLWCRISPRSMKIMLVSLGRDPSR